MRSLPRLALALALALSLGLIPPQASAGVKLTGPDCSTPYRAAYTWLNWLQPALWEPETAASCFVADGPGVSRDAVAVAAAQLKEVVDARGWWIPLDDFPDDPDYENGETGRGQYQVLTQIPEVYLEKVGDRWRFSPESIKVAERLHHETFNVGLQTLIDRAPPWMRRPFLGLMVWQYIGILILLGLAFPLGRLLGGILGYVGKALFRRGGLTWGPGLIDRIAEPLRLFGGAAIVWVLIPQLRLSIQFSVVLAVAIKLFAASAVVWGLYRAVDILSEYMTTRAEGTSTRLDDQLVPLVRKSLKITVVILGLIFILQNLSVDVGSLIAGLGIGGLAFALAAKDTIANLFGSLTIFLDRPFQIGDWVLTSGVEGVVESVGFRSTRIRTFANSLITVPNARVADSIIDNMGERTYRRLKTVLNLTYDTTPEQMQAFVEGVRAILKANPYIRQDYYEVHFYSYGSHSLDVLLYAFLKVPSWSEELRQKHNIFLEIMRLAREVGVGFAFPTQTLHVDSIARPGEPTPHNVPGDDALIAAVHAFGPDGRLARPDGPRLTEGYFAGVDSAKGSAGE